MSLDETLIAAAEETDLNVGLIKDRVDAVLADELYWFPVRHHSPSVASQLRSVMLKRKPKMVFIEGPFEANHLLPHIVDVKTKPPIAIYSSYRDDDDFLGFSKFTGSAEFLPPRFSGWYPMLSYSPEYVAIQTANSIGAKVQFIDLPAHSLLKPLVPPDDEQTSPFSAGAPDSIPPVEGVPAERAVNPTLKREGSDSFIPGSSFYQRLAATAGFRSWDEAWDSLFEIQEFGQDPEMFRREFAFFCAAVRATASKVVSALDGTIERERFMLKNIRETMATSGLSPSDCMVVCGGFHLFLDQNDTTPPPVAPPGTVYTSVVPYSFYRISELSGYGAGNRAPQFYQTMWDLRQKNRKQDLLVEHVVTVLKLARRGGEHVSSADAISTCQHAEMLSRLRGRHTAILDDMRDAIITCCCKGDPAEEGLHLLKALDIANIGSKIGRVTDLMGRLPIVQDFYAQVDKLGLAEFMENEKRIALNLDKRESIDSRRSVFFHRLKFLAITMASKTASASGVGSNIFKESWAMRWKPEIEASLVECSLLGDTIESATLVRLREKLAVDANNASKTSATLIAASDMDLPNLIPDVEDALSRAIENDNKFASLSQSLVNLCVLEKHANYKNSRKGVVDRLIERAYDKACFTICDVIAVPEEQQSQVVSCLMSIAEIILRGDKAILDRNLFIENVRNAAGLCEVQFLRGALLGILTELRVNSSDDLAKELMSLVKSSSEIMLGAGDFLDGIMAASRTSILLGAEPLIAAVDELLRTADYQQFLIMLPRMRGAFERLHEVQRDNFAQSVARRYGLEDSDTFGELTASLETTAFIAHIDFRTAEIMKEWSF